jgi:hypothetical protein
MDKATIGRLPNTKDIPGAPPLRGHLFYGLEDALVIEYSPQVYEKEDSYRIDLS